MMGRTKRCARDLLPDIHVGLQYNQSSSRASEEQINSKGVDSQNPYSNKPLMYIRRKQAKSGGRVVIQKDKKKRSMEVTSCNVRTPQPRVGNKNLGAHKRGTTTSDTEDGETEIPPEGEVQGSRANKENTIVIKKTGSGGGLQGNINRDEDEDEQRRPQRAGKQVVEDEENEDEDDEEEEPPQPQPRKKVNQQKVAKTRKKKLHIPDDDYVIPIQRNAQTLGLPPYGGKVLIGYEESWEKRIYETPDHRGDECQILYIFIPFCWHFNSSFVH